MTGAATFTPSAVRAAADTRELRAAGRPMTDLFRHVVLPLLDDYGSVLRSRGTVAAAAVFDQAPVRAGGRRAGGLAEHLAHRDGWEAPEWAFDPARRTLTAWWVPQLPGLQVPALRDGPLPFRRRGVFFDTRSLERV